MKRVKLTKTAMYLSQLKLTRLLTSKSLLSLVQTNKVISFAHREQQFEPSKLYKFPLKQTKEEKEREKLMADSQKVISASQQSRVDQVTHDLVQWMVDLVSTVLQCVLNFFTHRSSQSMFNMICEGLI